MSVQEAQERRYDAARRAAENGTPLPPELRKAGGHMPSTRDITHEFMVIRFGVETLCLSDLARLDYTLWRLLPPGRPVCNVWWRQRKETTWHRFPPPEGFFAEE